MKRHTAGRELRVEEALTHFEIALAALNAHLPVDWAYVAYRMAATLAGWEPPKQEALWPDAARRSARGVS